MKIFLDDHRTPPRDGGYTYVDNYTEFQALLDKYSDSIEEVSLDYELGRDSFFTGYDALKYMKKKGIKPKRINVHSTHFTGRDKMLAYAEENFPDALVTGESGLN